MRYKRLLITGGSGFIGSAFVRYALRQEIERLVNLDALTYAACLSALDSISSDDRYRFVQGSICHEVLVEKLCLEEQIDCIVHFAAESHVDRSIAGPGIFVETNVKGTLALLEVVRRHPHIHFHHISTDEVYGALGQEGCFDENSPYNPSSPYAASKAASDHLVRAYGHTYGLSYTLSHCTNNYGPFQHQEKLIPRMLDCLQRKVPLPLYGGGSQVRDWIFVDDHVEAIWCILDRSLQSKTYAIGASCQKSNRELLHLLISLFADATEQDPEPLRGLITNVADRPGHDFRYALCADKIRSELGWTPRYALEKGLHETVHAYLPQLNGGTV